MEPARRNAGIAAGLGADVLLTWALLGAAWLLLWAAWPWAFGNGPWI